MKVKLEGVITAIVTPFATDGSLDLEAVDRIVDRQIEGGVHGILAAGTTGEAPSLEDDERRALFERVAGRVDGRVPVIGGAGTNSLASSVKYMKMVAECGLDAALVVVPYYNKPTAEGLVDYFGRIMDAVDLPVVAYNVPSRTSCDLRLPELARIAEHPNLAAVKEATGDMARASEIHRELGGRIALLSGDDPTFLPLLACGGDGIVATSANVDPAGMVEIWEAWRRGDIARARETHERLLHLYRAMFVETNPGPAKYALARMGVIEPVIRPPLVMPGEDSGKRIDAALDRP